MSRRALTQYPMAATTSTTGDELIQTRVLEAGSGDDVVVCVHGVGSRADRFAPTIEALATAGYHAYALDLPGHGLADKSALPLSVPFYAEFVAGVVAQLKAGRLTLAGTSLGGNVCGQMLRLPGARPDRLALIGTLGIVALTERERTTISRVALQRRSLHDTAGKLRALLHDDSLVTPQLVQEETRINNSRGTEETFRRLGHYFETAINDDLVLDDVRAAQSEIEIGLMWGDQDAFVTVDTARRCMEALPECRMVWLRDTGHAPYFERPEAFVDGLQELFAAHDTAPREVVL